MPGEVAVIVSPDLPASMPEALRSDFLQLTVTNRITPIAGIPHQVVITVWNTSSSGRMAKIEASYDENSLTVNIPHSCIYVAPEGKTQVSAKITALKPAGSYKVFFTVN